VTVGGNKKRFLGTNEDTEKPLKNPSMQLKVAAGTRICT
jgi:hypothetical protein